MTTVLEAGASAVFLLATVGLLAACLLALARGLKTSGILAWLLRMVAHPQKGRQFLTLFSIVVASLFAFGILESIELLAGSNAAVEWAQVFVYLVGAFSVGAMIVIAWDTAELTISEELDLRETLPGAIRAAEGTSPNASVGVTASMYVTTRLSTSVSPETESPLLPG